MSRKTLHFVSTALIAGWSSLAWIWFAGVALLVLVDGLVLNYTEGLSLLHGVRWLEGEPLYPPVSQAPYVAHPYPPVYAVATGAMVELFGRDLLGPRLLTILCELAIVTICAAYLFRTTGRRGLALVFASLLGGVFALHKFHGLARLDFLCLALMAGGLYQLARFEHRRARTALPLFVLLFLIALFTKCTAAVPLLVCLGWYGFRYGRERKRADRDPSSVAVLVAILVTLLLYAIFFLLLNHRTAGEFYRHTFYYQSLRPAWADYTTWPSTVAIQFFAPQFLFGLVALVMLRGHGLLRLLTVASLAVFLVTSTRSGAGLNYSLEPQIYLLVLTGLAADRWTRTVARPRQALALTVLLVLSLGAYSMLTPARFRWVYVRETLAARDDRRFIDEIFARGQGLTLSEEPYFAVKHDRPYVLGDLYMLDVLAGAGEFSYEPVLELVRQGRIPYILVSYRVDAIPGMREILAERYREVYRSRGRIELNPWLVYVPK